MTPVRVFYPFVLLFSLLAINLFSQSYKLSLELGPYESGILAMTKDPLKKYLIAGDQKGYIYFHDLSTGKLLKKSKVHGTAVRHLQFNSTGGLLISSTDDGEIKIYDFKKERVIQAIYSPDYSGIHFVLFSIADGFIYFNGNNRMFKTRSDLTQKVEPVLDENDTINDAVITRDRSALIYATGNELKVLNTWSDVISQNINTGGSKIREIALINDTLLATWSQDGTIYFWNYRNRQLEGKPVYFLKAGSPSSLNFSDDFKLMCSGNTGNWARVWRPMERTIQQELFAHSSVVTSACFGVNDNALYTGSLDGKILLWRYLNEIPEKPLIIETQKPVEHIKDVKLDQGILLNEDDIPIMINDRRIISSQRVEVNTSEMDIFIYDNSYDDGDTMSLIFNGNKILDRFGVTKVKEKIKLNLIPNANNYLIMFADNLGKSPPNTAVIEFMAGSTKKIIRLTSDLSACSSINFYYTKE